MSGPGCPLHVDTSLNRHTGLMAPPCSLHQFPSLWEGNSCPAPAYPILQMRKLRHSIGAGFADSEPLMSSGFSITQTGTL